VQIQRAVDGDLGGRLVVGHGAITFNV